MAPVAKMKERDQRFLLIGIGPPFKEKPARAAAANPRMQAHTIHLRSDVCSKNFICGQPDNPCFPLLMHDKYAAGSCPKPD